MKDDDAIAALAALAQGHRLDAFRLLMGAGPDGLPAGEIAERLGVGPSSLSFHLAQLERAGLVSARRDRQRIIYRVEIGAMSRLVTFLTRDCCNGSPEICGMPSGRPAGRTDIEEDRRMTGDRLFNVLFLCTGNTARSIMAEAILGRIAGGRFRAFSAGSHPRGEVHPFTLDLLRKEGLPINGLRSKNWDEFTAPGAPEMDFVFTVCDTIAGEKCPVWAGWPMTAHWGVPDPVAVEGTEAERRFAFADAYRMLSRRIGIFANLPVEALDRMSLQRRLDSIGEDNQ